MKKRFGLEAGSPSSWKRELLTVLLSIREGLESCSGFFSEFTLSGGIVEGPAGKALSGRIVEGPAGKALE